MRILFMGTPEFAVASLDRLLSDGHRICGVFTQPDKPRNRGHKVSFSPVKEYALSKELDVYQPVTLRDGAVISLIRNLSPDLTVVAAYGKILPEEILSIPPLGSINVHSSLLPKYRGAAPINWAILNGDTVTGVSIMYMTKALDAGDVILQKQTEIMDTEDAPALTDRLAKLGAETLSEAVLALETGTASATPQDHGAQTYAPMLSREMAPINWDRSAREISCQVRGLIPWPCASTDILGGEVVKLYEVQEMGLTSSGVPGTVISAGRDGIDVICGDGNILRILELKAPGGKRMTAGAYLLGHPLRP